MFIETKQFEFIKGLEEKWKIIKEELLGLEKEDFQPWIQKEMYDKGWTIYPLYVFGKEIKMKFNKCPITKTICENVPGISMAGFSSLAPKTHVKPHVGWANSVYRLHLGLIVPDNCFLRVGNQTQQWAEGECLVFDDTVEHEAWNRSEHQRIVLLLDFLRPGFDSTDDSFMPEEVSFFANQLNG